MNETNYEISEIVKTHSQIYRYYCSKPKLQTDPQNENQIPQKALPIKLKIRKSVFNIDSQNYSECFANVQLDHLNISIPVYCTDLRAIYIGQFFQDQKNGYGLICFKDGSFYEGQFKNDSASGFGKIGFTNLNIYEGEVDNYQPKTNVLGSNIKD